MKKLITAGLVATMLATGASAKVGDGYYPTTHNAEECVGMFATGVGMAGVTLLISAAILLPIVHAGHCFDKKGLDMFGDYQKESKKEAATKRAKEGHY